MRLPCFRRIAPIAALLGFGCGGEPENASPPANAAADADAKAPAGGRRPARGEVAPPGPSTAPLKD